MSERSEDDPGSLRPGDPLGPPPEPPELPETPPGPFGPSSSEPVDEPAAQPPMDGPGALPREPMPEGVPPSPGPPPEDEAEPASDRVAPSEPPARSDAPSTSGEALSSGGLWGSGDPLAGSAPGSTGYTSPPPPGAGGTAPVAMAGVPGETSSRYTLASWGSRAVAQLIDGLIIGAGAIVLFFVFTAIFSAGFAAGDETGFASIIVGLLLWTVSVAIIALLYAPTLMARTNGQTIGRKVAGIRVVRTSGESMTFGFAVIREVVVKAIGVGILSSLTVGLFYFLDVLWPLWDEENRALHDFVVGTRTVKA